MRVRDSFQSSVQEMMADTEQISHRGFAPTLTWAHITQGWQTVPSHEGQSSSIHDNHDEDDDSMATKDVCFLVTNPTTHDVCNRLAVQRYLRAKYENPGLKLTQEAVCSLQALMQSAVRLYLVDHLGVGDQWMAGWRKQAPQCNGFMDLPSEIRLLIYTFCAYPPRPIVRHPFPSDCSTPPTNPGLVYAYGFPVALLQLNRQINEEAKTVFHHRNKLIIAVNIELQYGSIQDLDHLIRGVQKLLPCRSHLFHNVRTVALHLRFNADRAKRGLFDWQFMAPRRPLIRACSDQLSSSTANDLENLTDVLRAFSHWQTLHVMWEDYGFYQAYWDEDIEPCTLPLKTWLHLWQQHGLLRCEGWPHATMMYFLRKTRRRIMREILRPLRVLHTKVSIRAKIGGHEMLHHPELHDEFVQCLTEVRSEAEEGKTPRFASPLPLLLSCGFFPTSNPPQQLNHLFFLPGGKPSKNRAY